MKDTSPRMMEMIELEIFEGKIDLTYLGSSRKFRIFGISNDIGRRGRKKES